MGFESPLIGDNLAASAANLARDGLALRVEAKARSALSIGADAVIRQEAGQDGHFGAYMAIVVWRANTPLCIIGCEEFRVAARLAPP